MLGRNINRKTRAPNAGATLISRWSLSCAGHVLRRSDLFYMTHHSPLLWGKVAMKKMAIINTF